MLKFVDNNKAAVISGDPMMDPGFDEYDIVKEDNKMTKTKLKEWMKKHCLVWSELEDMIDFVSELLYLRRKELTDDEPYATRTIDDLFKAEHTVYDLIEWINELED